MDYAPMPPVGYGQDDDEEQRRRLLANPGPRGNLMMPFMPAVPMPGLQTSANSGLPGPLANLVRNPDNLLMPAAGTVPIRPTRSTQADPPSWPSLGATASGSEDSESAPLLRPNPQHVPIEGTPSHMLPSVPGTPDRSHDLLMRAGSDPRAVPLPQSPNAPGGGVALAQSGSSTDSAAPASDPGMMPAASNVPIAPIGTVPTSRPGLQPLAPMPRPMTELERLQQNGPGVSRLPGKLGTLARIGDVAGSIIAPNVMAAIPGTTLHNRALQRQASEDLDQQRQNETADLTRRNVQSEIAERDRRAQPDNPQDKKLDAYVNDQGQQTIIFQRPDGSTYEKPYGKVQGKQEKLTSPFEAFAYGTPAERQSAKDFIDFENQTRAKNERPEKPGEVEQRYQLYLKDPEAYKAMYGDRGAAQDQTQSARMLKYFDGQRKRIEQDWTLDEPTRAQQLQEIDRLERPYLDSAAGAPGEDRVTVVSPDGVQGTIPRSQLPAAQKKGYQLGQ